MRDLVYLCTFLIVIALTAITIAYIEGGIDEQLRQTADVNAAIEQEQAKTQYWHGKYQSLSHEDDFLTVVDAERQYQEAGR